ncbi:MULTISPECIES: type VI secretion system protein TssA [unclassified Lysobacter]|uniref:type VI secretion system protein TssA n=1 Tax=unclassified Lysobacter TaxID=2635362 RepID=UPI001BE6B95F|nr:MULTISPECIES: type VI secretion system protein TssA [unclassified Lysobacter]MBT2744834.1 type VI secretion system protein TssA [Lysobacter sp. ISL-42]MBT2752173.1 type VI secretion system protein TssA [Lysobacter sp. ISL-50]MBT2778670.1 type VI secretion system protein TssA [Lysobacter sp. ISL-54]MBT2780399.1 type VI secretion system protein TssA [Lysobacter sp. ISL-52]
MAIDIDALLAPISADAPCGEDAGFSDLFDRIREARRADDASLPQGEWQTQVKLADWRLALDLSVEALSRVSKDLQAAGWLGEALIARHGLDGARDAFAVIAGLIERHWDGLHPLAEGEDLEERAGKLAWFNSNAAAALQRMPLNTDAATAVTLIDWQTSREVDNLARQNAEAHQAALAEGKLGGEAFDARIRAVADADLRGMLAGIAAAQTAYAHLKSVADAKFGRASPSLAEIESTLKRIAQVLQQAAKAKGLLNPAGAAAGEGEDSSAGASPRNGAAVTPLDLGGDSRTSKQAALRALGDIAGYFKRTEPHSPVASLLEQAVQWADMPLNEFLAEVVRDDSVLAAIRARVGLKQ